MKVNVNEQNYVDEAEKAIKILRSIEYEDKKTPKLTTTKLRSLLAMTADIYNIILNQNEDILSEEICSRIEYLRVRFLYEAGREKAVKRLLDNAGILELMKGIKGSKKKFVLFNRYIEALVAFHRYYGGRDI